MKNSFLIFLTLLAAAPFASARESINLDGSWNFGFSPESIGQHVILPGTLDTNGIGESVTDSSTTQLSRKVRYEGPAYFEKTVNIPKDWKNQDIILKLGRTRPSTVWVDGQRVGSQRYLSTPHVYNLSEYLRPGRHTIRIMVDNGDSIPGQIKSNSHAATESTQTNWNGILGDILLTATPKFHISSLTAKPDFAAKTFKVNVSVSDVPKKCKKELIISCGDVKKAVRVKSGVKDYEATVNLGAQAKSWSDKSPYLHEIQAIIPGVDTVAIKAGMRDFKVQDTHHIAVNDTITFLRGRHDACVFPLTGHAPMTVDEWRKYFQICKEYGLNHVRFHSWTPPEAAFDAADIEGFYLQPELPIWGGFDKEHPELMDFLMDEGRDIITRYGHHPSFVMFSLGNELWGDGDLQRSFVDEYRKLNPDILYAMGTNAFLGWQGNREGEDFTATCRIGGGEGYSTHTRASFSFADADDGGWLNHTRPNTIMNFEKAVQLADKPVVGHETGQYQVFVNFEEIPKYTGILEPRNFEVFRRRLEAANLSAQVKDFFEASGKWSAQLYKQDMEMNFRTPSMAGFQLLDLQDYPGQGTALVGILDAFMDSKGLISPEEWRQSCDQIVLLAEFPTFTLTEGENFPVSFKVSNYSTSDLKGQFLKWSLLDGNKTLALGSATIDAGFGLRDVDSVNIALPKGLGAKKLRLHLAIPEVNVENNYDLWIYPTDQTAHWDDVVVADSLTNDVLEALARGGKVLLAPKREDVKEQSVGSLFQTDYWNYRMFRTISENAGKEVSPGTLGVLTDPTHPALADFPNDGHSDWQWFGVVKNAYPLILDQLNAIDYRPIIQSIDNVERNHRLGIVSEFAVGPGRLMLLAADIEALKQSPEGRQLLVSLANYMNGKDFKPSTALTPEQLNGLLTHKAEGSSIDELRNISYD